MALSPDGHRFREMRQYLKLTQAELASMLGLGSGVRISEIENGTSTPTEMCKRLMSAYVSGYRPADWPK